MRNVLIYHKVDENHLNYLREKYPNYNFYACTHKEDMEKYIGDADALISFKCDKEMLSKANKAQGVTTPITTRPINHKKAKANMIPIKTMALGGPKSTGMVFRPLALSPS